MSPKRHKTALPGLCPRQYRYLARG